MGSDRSSATSATSVGAVARRGVKPRPRVATARAVKNPAEAREVVRDWIVSAGVSPTEERIAALLPVARVWSAKARRVAIGLVAAGHLPTRAAVESVTRERIEAKKLAAAALRAQADAFVAARGPEAAAWVREFGEVHGHGPSWHELGEAMQLDYRRREATIRALEREGWISTAAAAGRCVPGPPADAPASQITVCADV